MPRPEAYCTEEPQTPSVAATLHHYVARNNHRYANIPRNARYEKGFVWGAAPRSIAEEFGEVRLVIIEIQIERLRRFRI